MEREYWKKAQEGVTLEDYPDVDDDIVEFPPDIHIAFAVCTKRCGSSALIVDGGPQICDRCGKVMFRTAVRRYTLATD